MIIMTYSTTWTIKDTDTQEILATGTFEIKNSRVVGFEKVVEKARQIAKDRHTKLSVGQGNSTEIFEDYTGFNLTTPKPAPAIKPTPASWVRW